MAIYSKNCRVFKQKQMIKFHITAKTIAREVLHIHNHLMQTTIAAAVLLFYFIFVAYTYIFDWHVGKLVQVDLSTKMH